MGAPVLKIQVLLSIFSAFHFLPIVFHGILFRMYNARIVFYISVLLILALHRKQFCFWFDVKVIKILFVVFSIRFLSVNIYVWDIFSPRFLLVWCFDYCRFEFFVPYFYTKKDTFCVFFCSFLVFIFFV